MDAETVHAPAAGDCLRCHEAHFAEETHLLTENLFDLCGDCHDLKDADFSRVHLDIDPALMNCVSCHTPHSSTDPRLFKGEAHAPFAAGSCEECHLVKTAAEDPR